MLNYTNTLPPWDGTAAAFFNVQLVISAVHKVFDFYIKINII